MKKSFAGLWVGLAALLCAAVYSAVLFLVKTAYDPAFWILYAFTMTAFLITGVQSVVVCRKHGGLVLDEALGIISSVYFGIQFILGGIVGMCFAGLPVVPVLICEIVLLSAYLVFAFIMYAAQSHGSAQDHNEQNAVRKMRFLESDLIRMADEQKDSERKKALKALAETVHFSDVSTDPALAEIEGRIAESIAALEEALSDEEADIKDPVDAVRRLLKERDRTAAILKR